MHVGRFTVALLVTFFLLASALPGMAVTKESQLVDAVAAKDVTEVHALIAAGADVNEQSGKPLKVAAIRGYLDIAAALIDAGAHLDAPGYPLHAAVSSDQIDLVTLLLKRGANANALDMVGNTPLILAVISENGLPVLKVLLASGADPLVMDRANGMNALHWAALRGKLEAADRLLATGIDINIREGGSDKFTSLHNAASVGEVAVVKLLIDHHADVNRTDAYGRTPLAVAVGDESKAILIEAGAKIK